MPSKETWKSRILNLVCPRLCLYSKNRDGRRGGVGGGGGNHGSTQPKAVHTGSFFTEGYWRIPVRHYLGLDQGTGSGGGEK